MSQRKGGDEDDGERQVGRALDDQLYGLTPTQGGTDMPTPLSANVNHIRTAVAALYLSNDGDAFEKDYWPTINDGFPNYERFWRLIVVPTTKRIENPKEPNTRIDRRDGLAEDLWLITYVNYSLFLNLVGAFESLSQPLSLSVGDFYTHLASACDLAEDFLLRVHVCVSECRGQPVNFNRLTREEFLQRAGESYDRDYEKTYVHSHAKGKAMLVRIPPCDTCSEHLNHNQGWKDYVRFTNPIRTYRNIIVHDVMIGTVQVGKLKLMPRVERIKKYAALAEVRKAVKDAETLRKDFVVREEQMFSDFRTFKQHLNALWDKPINDLEKLLYDERNPALLLKYNFAVT